MLGFVKLQTKKSKRSDGKKGSQNQEDRRKNLVEDRRQDITNLWKQNVI